MNLLGDTEKNDLKKGIKLRLLIVALTLTAIAFLVGLVMLLPSYFLLRGHFSETNKDQVIIGDSINELLNIPKEIESKLEFFESNNANISTVDVVEKVVEKSGGGVKINSISVNRNDKYQDKNGIRVLISGTATTRESLLSFGNALKDADYFYSVDVPVSSFTKDRNLPFSINLFVEN